MRNTPQSIPDLMKDWEVFLKANPKNFLRIKDLDKSTWVTSEGINPTYFNWEDILSKHPDAQHWFDQLILKHALGNILVHYKRTNGSSSVYDKERKPEKYDVSPRRIDLNNAGAKPANNTAVPQQQPTVLPTNGSAPPAPTNVPANPDYQFQVMQHMGGLGAAGLAAGLGYRDLVDLEKRADLSDTYKEERDRLRKENDILTIENRDLNSKVNNATTEKDLAIRLAQMEAKSWADPEMISNLIKSAGPLFAQAMQKRGGDPAQLGMGAGMSLTPPKQKFVEYLADPEFPDEKVNVLEGVLVMLVRIPGFQEQLEHLINQQYADNNSNS